MSTPDLKLSSHKPSLYVQRAAVEDYPQRIHQFFLARHFFLTSLIRLQQATELPKH